VKPIIGVETYIRGTARFDSRPRIEGHGKPFHLVLLAKDFTGYQNLGARGPRRTLERLLLPATHGQGALRKHSKGLIAALRVLQGDSPGSYSTRVSTRR